jgi:hypothetical protein
MAMLKLTCPGRNDACPHVRCEQRVLDAATLMSLVVLSSVDIGAVTDQTRSRLGRMLHRFRSRIYA